MKLYYIIMLLMFSYIPRIFTMELPEPPEEKHVTFDNNHEEHPLRRSRSHDDLANTSDDEQITFAFPIENKNKGLLEKTKELQKIVFDEMKDWEKASYEIAYLAIDQVLKNVIFERQKKEFEVKIERLNNRLQLWKEAKGMWEIEKTELSDQIANAREVEQKYTELLQNHTELKNTNVVLQEENARVNGNREELINQKNELQEKNAMQMADLSSQMERLFIEIAENRALIFKNEQLERQKHELQVQHDEERENEIILRNKATASLLATTREELMQRNEELLQKNKCLEQKNQHLFFMHTYDVRKNGYLWGLCTGSWLVIVGYIAGKYFKLIS